jgi:hypothetical protein
MARKSVDWKLVDNYVDKYIEAKIEQAVVLSLKQTGSVVIGEASKNAPVLSGDLKKSGSYKVNPVKGQYSITYKFSTPYARRQNYEHKNPQHREYLTKAIAKSGPYLLKQVSTNIKRTIG